MSPQAKTIPDPYCVEIDWGIPHTSDIPPDSALILWIRRALASQNSVACEVAVRVMSAPEMALLNQQFRGKAGPTNVLSFGGGDELEADHKLLGDIAICYDVVCAEAAEQGKSIEAHLAHMCVHGTLHLLGFDHEAPDDATRMEKIEVAVMADFGFPDPYGPGSAEEGSHHE